MGFSASNDKAAGSGNWQVGSVFGGNSMSNEQTLHCPGFTATHAAAGGAAAGRAALGVLEGHMNEAQAASASLQLTDELLLRISSR